MGQAVKAHGILFAAPMVRAIKAGIKRQTRRTALPRWEPGDILWVRENWRVSEKWDAAPPRDLPPRTMTVVFDAGGSVANSARIADEGAWREDEWPRQHQARPDWIGKSRVSMFLPYWANRITLQVESVRAEPLLHLTEDDAKAEGLTWAPPNWGVPGMARTWLQTPQMAYFALWDEINGMGEARKNPTVYVTTFRDLGGCVLDLHPELAPK